MKVKRKGSIWPRVQRKAVAPPGMMPQRLSSELRERVDAWAAKQSDKPARPEAILRLVELGLETTRRRESAPNRAAKASEMAAQEIDRISDPSATKEERQRRKRRLIKGPKEFRDIHKRSRVKIDSDGPIFSQWGQVIRQNENPAQVRGSGQGSREPSFGGCTEGYVTRAPLRQTHGCA